MTKHRHPIVPHPFISTRHAAGLAAIGVLAVILSWIHQPAPAWSQTQPEMSPKEVFDAASSQLAQQDWTGFAEYLHSQSLQEFVFYLLKVTEIRTATGAGDETFDLLFGRPTPDEVRAAPPTVLFANFLASAADVVPEFGHLLADVNYTTLGMVEEGDTLRHIVVRRKYTIGDSVAERVEVVTAQLEVEQWKLHLYPSMVTLLDEIGLPKLK